MTLDNLDYDLLCEGLTLLLHDRYSMPREVPEFRRKAALVLALYDRIQEERREA